MVLIFLSLFFNNDNYQKKKLSLPQPPVPLLPQPPQPQFQAGPQFRLTDVQRQRGQIRIVEGHQHRPKAAKD